MIVVSGSWLDFVPCDLGWRLELYLARIVPICPILPNCERRIAATDGFLAYELPMRMPAKKTKAPPTMIWKAADRNGVSIKRKRTLRVPNAVELASRNAGRS